MIKIHPSARIAKGVELGHGCVIGANVEILSGARIGAYSTIGGPPESREYFNWNENRSPGVRIGARARIFEHVSIHAGTRGVTLIGDDAAVFSHSLIAHDTWVHREAIVAGGVMVAGWCSILPRAFVGAGAVIHQRSIIGAYAMLGAGAMFRGLLPHGEKWTGSNSARYAGWNSPGLERFNEQKDGVVANYRTLLNSEEKRISFREQYRLSK